MSTRLVLLVSLGSVFLTVACGTDVTVFNDAAGGAGQGGGISSGPTVGGGSSSVVSGPGGGSPECSDASECIGGSVCVAADCVGGSCVFDPEPAGTPCSDNGMVCDGNGECKSDAGAPCSDAGECLNNFCVDGVCCDGGCESSCEACNILGNEGTCSPQPIGTDPDGECMPGVCDDQQTCVSGEYVGAESYGGGNGNQLGRGVAVDSAGNVLVASYFSTSVDFGGGPLTSAGGFDIALAKLDSNGNHIWSKGFGDGDNQRGYDVAVDSSDNVVVCGRISGTIDFGGGPLVSVDANDVVIAKFDSAGNHIWSQVFAYAGDQFLQTIAVAPNGNVAIGGFFETGIALGGGFLASAGDFDAFLAEYDAAGNHIRSARFGDADDQRIYGVEYDDNGNLIATGRHIGSIDFGGGALTSAGDRDVFVVKFDGAGQHIWSNQYGDANFQIGWNLGVEPVTGNIAVVGEYFGTVDFGSGPHVSEGQEDAFVFTLDSAGNTLWSQTAGDGNNNQAAYDVAFNNAGHVVMVGEAEGTLDFGGGPIGGNAPRHAFAAKYTGAGDHLWSYMWGDTGLSTSYGVASTSTGSSYVVGIHSGDIDFGGGTLTAAANDGFLLELAP